MNRGRVPTFDEQNLRDAEILLDDAKTKVDRAMVEVSTAERHKREAESHMEFARQNHDRIKRGRQAHEDRRPKEQ